MKVGTTRKCDVCGTVIPPSETYKVAIMSREALSIFMNLDDPELQPTWQEVGDGSGKIRIETCLECSFPTGME